MGHALNISFTSGIVEEMGVCVCEVRSKLISFELPE